MTELIERDRELAQLEALVDAAAAGEGRAILIEGPALRRERRPVDALTASERRVAAFAADGQSNRDIAQALFVTPKTVEVHLSNAYRKLGIRSRRELGAALATG